MLRFVNVKIQKRYRNNADDQKAEQRLTQKMLIVCISPCLKLLTWIKN